MNKIAQALVATFVVALPGIAMAVPVTFVAQGGSWDYNQSASLGATGLTGIQFSDFTAGYTGASTGTAAFGNADVPGAPVNTTWDANSALYLQTTFNLTGNLFGDLTLNLAVDNGSAVFVNGTLVFNENAGGFTNIWEYSQTVSSSLLVSGINTISVIANDYGGLTYWDMELTGVVAEPGILALLGIGFAGIGFAKRKRA